MLAALDSLLAMVVAVVLALTFSGLGPPSVLVGCLLMFALLLSSCAMEATTSLGTPFQ